MDGNSIDIKEQNINRLKEVLPEVFTEGKVDWEKLKATLGEDINFENERYVLNWAGKSDAFKVLQQPTTATLIPDKEESVNFDDTEHVFIEGENLEVLKVLQKSYYGKVKMIYIDPPYNTGSDSFIYPDKFSETRDEYLKRVGEKDEEGYLTKEGLFRKNSRDSGHYHSNWLSMMYPRLFLARNLLRDDGVIFVSIDDNEVHNLRLMMNEIFGEENFVAIFPWRKRTAKSDVPHGVSQDFEWIVMFVKRSFQAGSLITRKYHSSDDYKEKWRLSDLTTQRTKDERPNSFFTMVNPKNGNRYEPNPNRVWGVTKDTFKNYYEKGKIVFPGDYDFLKITIPAFRVFENEDKEKNTKKFGSEKAMKPISTLLGKEVGRTEDGTKEIVDLFGSKIFPYPKPTSFMNFFINTITEDDFIVLDFFAGACTTAHSVIKLNSIDGKKRKFICVQMPEETDENSDAYKAGFKNIAEIGKKRIVKIIEKIKATKKEELAINSTELDLGFKAFNLKKSNFKIWRGIQFENGEQLELALKEHTNPVSEDAKEENILYELILKSGYELTSKIEDKGDFYIVNGELVIALSSMTEKIVKAILDQKPQKCITLDKLFEGNDQLKTNTVLQMKDVGVEFKTI